MESRIINDPEVLSEGYIPEKILNREKELAQISNSLGLVNSFIYGASGSGKTILVKKAIVNFNSSNKAKVIYIDCSLYQTTNAILHEILISLNSVVVSKSNYELTKRLQAKLRHVEGRIIICLDHFEHLKEIETVDKILSLGLGLMIIAESKEAYRKLSRRAKASLTNFIEIKPYTKDQVFEILKERAEKALQNYTYSDETLESIAEASHGDLALALNLLKSLALKAENEGKESMDEVEFEYEADCTEDGNLNVDQKAIMKILREWKSLPAGRLYDFYCEKAKYPKSRRTFRNYMRNLSLKGLVKDIGKKRGRIYELIEEAVE